MAEFHLKLAKIADPDGPVHRERMPEVVGAKPVKARRPRMVRRHMPCGRSGCGCAEGPDNWHGPYYQWTRKVKGKTITIRLTPEEAQLMSSYVRNDRQLRRVVAQMRAISLKVVQAQIKAVSHRRKRLLEIRG